MSKSGTGFLLFSKVNGIFKKETTFFLNKKLVFLGVVKTQTDYKIPGIVTESEH